MDTVGERLRAERKRLGLNQTELAAVGGVGRKSLGLYEDDHRAPDTEFLNAIATTGADVAYIVTGVRSGAHIPPEDGKLLDKVVSASPIDKQTISRVIDAILHDRRGVSVNPADNLPEQVLLKQMFGTLLSTVRPGAGLEETADFLSRYLESALRALEGDWEIRIDPDYQGDEEAPKQRRA